MFPKHGSTGFRINQERNELLYKVEMFYSAYIHDLGNGKFEVVLPNLTISIEESEEEARKCIDREVCKVFSAKMSSD